MLIIHSSTNKTTVSVKKKTVFTPDEVTKMMSLLDDTIEQLDKLTKNVHG